MPFEFPFLCLPFLLQTHGSGNTLVILQRIRGIGFGIQIIDTEIENGLIILPPQALTKEEQLTESVCFESRAPRGWFGGSLNLHHAGCHIAILGGGYTADNLHFFNIIGGDGTHIHSCSDAVSFRVRSADIRLNILHIRIGAHRCAIYHK